MKLTIAMAVAFLICTGSLVARASIVHRHSAEVAAQLAREAAANTPVRVSERTAMSGLDLRLMVRLHRLALHKRG